VNVNVTKYMPQNLAKMSNMTGLWLTYQVSSKYSKTRFWPGLGPELRWGCLQGWGGGYPWIFITWLLSTQHCRLNCEFDVIDNIYHVV